MKTRLVTLLISLALTALAAGSSSAQASLVAGWDFSQYAGDGFLSIDGGATFTNTLSANYSDLDPTFGAGFESAAFGTMYVDGSFGSTPVTAGSGSEEFLPSAAVGGSLLSNLDAPSLVDFDAFTVLQSEGQLSAESLAMTAPAAVSVVFEADLTGAARTGSNWSLSLGGRTSTGSSSVAVEFSSDGTSFGSLGSLNLTAVDSTFTVSLGAASTDLAYVRLTFNPVGTAQPLIDNVALNADLSEPPTTTTTTVPTTTTTTSTSTSVPASTTTSTSVPASTTTTTSTTAPVSTTTSTSIPGSTTTTTPTSSTTTTTLPSSGDLSGQYPFVDKSTGDANTSLLNVDTSLGQICLAGQVQETDETSSLPATVTFTYDSIGAITKDTDKKVLADFVTASLTLDISGTNVTPYNQLITLNCKLEASLLKEGSRDKVKLLCELGDNFAAFPGLTSQQITYIDNAYAKVKRAKANSKNGKLKISTVGVPAEGGVPITCDFPAPG
jgi:hypothetical protein